MCSESLFNYIHAFRIKNEILSFHNMKNMHFSFTGNKNLKIDIDEREMQIESSIVAIHR